MLIASTLASAACGKEIASSAVISELARERGGAAQASLWFDAGPKLPVAEAAQVNAVMSDAAASDDSDLRAIVHCGTPLVATALPRPKTTAAPARRCWRRSSSDMRPGADRRRDQPGFPRARASRPPAAIFVAAVAAGRLLQARREQTAHDDRADRDLGRRPRRRRRYQHRARVPCRAGAMRRHRRRPRRRARVHRRGDASSNWKKASSAPMAARAAAGVTDGLGASLGHRHRHGGQAGAGRAPLSCLWRGRRQRRARRQRQAPKRSRASPLSRPGLPGYPGPRTRRT